MNEDATKSNQSFPKAISNLWFLTKFCFREEPVFMFFLISEAIKQFVLIFFEHVYGIRYVLESAETGQPFRKVLQYLVVLSIIIGLNLTSFVIYRQSIQQKAKPRLVKALKEHLYEKAKELDLSCYDDPLYYNDFVLAVSEAEKTLERYLRMVQTFFMAITVVITYGAFFLVVDRIAIAFVITSFILTFFISKLYNKLSFEARISRNPYERKRAYTQRVFYLNEFAKEVRLNSDVSELLYDAFEDTNDEIYKIDKKYANKLWGLGFLKTYLSNDFIMEGLYISYLIYQAVVLHTITYSSAVVLFNSARSLKNSFRDLAELSPKAIENSLYTEKIRDFLSFESKITSERKLELPTKPKILELKNVSYAYNAKDGNVINNVSLTIQPYEKVALIGYNGAGKTTLIKLLMRLYDTTQGAIYLDHVNIKEYAVESYRKNISAVFQDYKIYAATVRENVQLDYEKDVLDMQLTDDRIHHALQESGFDERLNTLERKLDTPLTTEFEKDGINLSGGESQKVAIARAFYEDSNIIILDEPSSSLDPIAEYNLNKAMKNAAQNKTVIYISHRLSTTKDADRIIMMENGSIVETGTHEELIALSGKYAVMWYAQAGRYHYING
jgi:ATP-binding cassette subfamily B protein